MRLWRRRKEAPPPVVLPSLDRLAGLIERVVELVDEVAGSPTAAPNPAPNAGTVPGTVPVRPVEQAPALAAAATEPADERDWLAFVPSPDGYTLIAQAGPLPVPGDALELDGVAWRVLRYAPSPLPGDHRRCVFVERQEPPKPDRSFDA
ncbi:MAG TPA: hypothetical protein VNP89_01270 [Gaiellaceae bacterium]|nr:hypothetical protein [Gaiellaceae bacterium]